MSGIQNESQEKIGRPAWGGAVAIPIGLEEHELRVVGEALRRRTAQLLRRSLHIRTVDTGSSGACESEIKLLTAPHYDLHRLGLFFTPTPRHADCLLVTGPGTRSMDHALLSVYEAMPDPKIVVAVGACALGGVFGPDGYSHGGIRGVLPVDVVIPGCPPSPLALLQGLLVAVDRFEERLGPAGAGVHDVTATNTTAVTLLVAAGCSWLVAGALAASWRRSWGLRSAAAASVLGGGLAVVAGLMVVITHSAAQLAIGGSIVGQVSLTLTPLAAVFTIALGVVAAAIGANLPRYHRAATGTSVYLLAYHGALIASLLILCAGTVTVFLVAWESMALTSYLLILRHHQDRGVADSAFLFIALGEAGFVMIVAALGILAAQAGSLDFAVIRAHALMLAPGWRNAVFLLALVGFGFKAGLVPLHIALPAADPVAPSDGAAFLSGIVTKLGVYGLALVTFQLLPAGPVWWGLLVMALGSLSALLGILYALMERDWKRFLAYSTIENIGIVMIALGASLTFFESSQPAVAALLLIAGLYHVLNHATYKTLLFLEAGVVEHAVGLRDLDRLGGLARRMPRTAIIALIGTLGIAALPPLNGFVSEWLIFQGLFQGFRIHSQLVGVLLVVTAATLALTGGLAVNAFARAFGIPFLGMPRSARAAAATERSQPVLGGTLLATVCLFLSLGAPMVLTGLDQVVASTTGVNILSRLIVPGLTVIPAHAGFSSFSPTYLAVCLVAMLAVPVLIVRGRRRQASDRSVPVWAGGIMRFQPRMQYTATTHANPVRVTFDGLYRPHIELSRASDDPAGQSGPVHYGFRVTPLFENYLYRPLVRLAELVARWARPIQSGDVNLYLLYVFVAILVAYVVAVT